MALIINININIRYIRYKLVTNYYSHYIFKQG